jgi:hypothetical protein
MAIDYGSNNITTSGNINVSGVVTATSGVFTNLLVNGSSFNSSVSGLLPSITGSSNIIVSSSNNIYTVSATGLQISLTNPVTGSGVANHIAYWNSASGIVSASGKLYWDSSNNRLGINTSSPTQSLEVSGNIAQTWTGNDQRLAMVYDNNWRMGLNHGAGTRTLNIFCTSNDTNGHIIFSTRLGAGSSATDYGTERMRITSSGVGIGTASPTGNLHVIGTGIFSTNIGVATNSPTAQLHVVGSGIVGNLKINGSVISNTVSNSGIILETNGVGPLQRSSGGNSRGQYAVDWQVLRNAVSDVAAGNGSVIGGGRSNTTNSGYSTVAGGYNNTCSAAYGFIGGGKENDTGGSYYGCETIGGGKFNSTGAGYSDYGTICGGYDNTLSGYAATICGGWGNIASYNRATVGGGGSNTSSGYCSTIAGGQQNVNSGALATIGGGFANYATATYSTVAGGESNTASGFYSMVPGGKVAVANKYGQLAHAAGSFAAAGDAQHSIFVLRNKTSGAVAGPTEMGLDGSTTRLTIDSGKILSGTINILGSKSDGATIARYLRQFTIKNVGGTTTLVSTATIGTDETNGTAISITANNTSDYLSIQTSGVNNQTWRWVAIVDCVDMAYGT